MKEQTNPNISTSYKEVQIGKTLYRVTSVFTGEKDLGQTLEQLAVRRAMAELIPCPVHRAYILYPAADRTLARPAHPVYNR